MQRKRRETPPPDPFEAYDLEGPRLVRGNEFLISLQYFLERNLCDVASLEITNLCTGTLEVATGLFAHWLHMLIDEIDCRCFLHMTAINRQRCTDIQIPFPASLLSIDKRKEMIILGSLTGATIMSWNLFDVTANCTPASWRRRTTSTMPG